MAKLLENQRIQFGDHILIVRSKKSGIIYAHCVDTCCSDPENRVAVKMPEDMFVKIVDTLNYKQALNTMTSTVMNIRDMVHGPSQQAVEGEEPDQSWEKQTLVMED